MRKIAGLFTLALMACLSACSPKGPLALFQSLSPHERYAQGLQSANLSNSAMGRSWLNVAETSWKNSLKIALPYHESGYFGQTEVRAVALNFQAQRGQKLKIAVTAHPAGLKIFTDLAQLKSDGTYKVIASADTTGSAIVVDIKQTGIYVLRLQPELLRSGDYTLTVTAGPSLDFPVAASGKPHIGSLWGEGRDEGGRKHEGIDIFAPKGTPALAAAKGTVTRVTENTLGGKVVFLHPDATDYELYYAHLGVQLVHDGQSVLPGDTVGLIDNTGNAKNTPSHLHFGIYTNGGAIDPLLFVQKIHQEPAKEALPLSRLGDTLRLLSTGEPVSVLAINGNHYRLALADGTITNVPGVAVTFLGNGAVLRLRQSAWLYDRPDTSATRIKMLAPAADLRKLAVFHHFTMVRSGIQTGWITAE